MATKSLLLLRHAKSSWDDPLLDDRDRPLNARGRKAAVRVGRLFRDESFAIDLVLCSTSTRTRETAKQIFAERSGSTTISYRDDLYHASADQLTDILRNVVEPTSSVLVIGHNPGFEDFLAQATGKSVHFPTAALAVIEFNIDRWSLLTDQTHGELKQLWRPRDLDAE